MGAQEEPHLISLCTPPALARYAGIADEEGGTPMHEDEPTTGQGPPDGDETGSDRRKLAEELFQVAADLPAEQRAAFLEEHCGADAPLRADVEELLHTYEAETVGFLRTPAFGQVIEPGEKPGDHIGPYKLSGPTASRGG